MHNFLPHTDADRAIMLKAIGVQSVADLFSDIPAGLRQDITYQHLPPQGLSEAELQAILAQRAQENTGARMACFLGGGAYNRFVPMAVNNIAGRAEFYTAYTPYQPEIAQGTLQVTYEFQSMICELTGMDVANASVYDGASAVTEAALMAMRVTKRHHVMIERATHPDYRKVLKTYLNGLGDVQITEFDINAFPQEAPQAACVIFQQPDYLGRVHDPSAVRRFCEQTGALMIVAAEPFSLGLLEPPGAYGADIVAGDIQPLGNNLSFGGPYGGYIASRQKHMRQLPGRLVGRTVDKTGRPCYTLTLQTREQHIRREKATSNICTNQALNILKATVYMSLVGPQGLRTVANLSTQRAHWLAAQLTRHEGVELLAPDQPFLFEFALKLPFPAEALLRHLEADGILGGIPLERDYPEHPHTLLIACTEMTTPENLQHYAASFERFYQSNPVNRKVEAAC